MKKKEESKKQKQKTEKKNKKKDEKILTPDQINDDEENKGDRKLSILKYNLFGKGAKTYTYRRCLQEKMVDKTFKSDYIKRKDFYGVDIDNKKEHQIFFDTEQNKVIVVENWKKYNEDISEKKKKSSICFIF